MDASVYVKATHPSERLLDSLAGLAVASFVFIPVLRAVIGVGNIVYVVPLAFLLATLVVVSSRSKASRPFLVRFFVLLAMILCMWLLLTSCWSISPDQVVADVILVCYLIALLIVVPFMCTPGVLVWTLNWIVAAGLFTAGVVFVSYCQAGSLRGFGTFIAEFYLTASVLLGASVVVTGARLSVARRAGLRQFVVLSVLLGGLALSLGRMALLSTITLMVILELYSVSLRKRTKNNPKNTFRAMVAGIVLLAMAAGLLWGSFQVERTATRLDRLFFNPAVELTHGRGGLWATAWKNIHSAPLFGHGLGSNGLMSGVSDSDYPHNLILQVWLDAGIIGVVLLVTMLFIPLLVFWHRRWNEGSRAALPFVAMYIFFVMQYQVSYNAYTARGVVLMGLLTTFSASYDWIRHSASASSVAR